jgi:hypothetical protein
MSRRKKSRLLVSRGEIVTLRQATRVRPHCRTRQYRHEMRSVIGNPRRRIR